MKTKAIIRIILFSAAIFALAGILIVGLGVGLFTADTDAADLPVAGDGQTNTGALGAAEIRNIHIDWVAGPITIHPDSGTDQITITETAPSNEKYHMVYRKNGNTLEIQFQEDNLKFGINNSFSKDLCITVPANWICNSLEIDSASSWLEVSDMTIDDFIFDSASGTCRFINCNVGDLELNTASGDLDFSGTLTGLDCETASGNCHLVLQNHPDALCFEGASGDLEIYLPDDCGFTAEIDALSGDFYSDFTTTKHDEQHIHGDGSCLIEVSALSGDVSIHRNESCNTATVADCTDESHDHSKSHH